MALDFHILPDRRIVLFRMSGAIDVPECIEAFYTYNEDPRFDPTLTFLTDTENLVRVHADFVRIVGAVQRTMRLYSRFRKGSHIIIHAPRDLNFGMARILQQVMEPVSPFQLDITRDAAEALARAGQPERSFAELERAIGLKVGAD